MNPQEEFKINLSQEVSRELEEIYLKENLKSKNHLEGVIHFLLGIYCRNISHRVYDKLNKRFGNIEK